MAIKKTKNFYGYELDFTRINNKNGKDEYQFIWDYQLIKDILIRCKTDDLADIKQIFGNWFLVVEDIEEINIEKENGSKTTYLAGRFVTGEYGRIGDLRNVDTMKTRKNNKQKREGEDKFIYFAIRKEDGLFLIQGDVKVSRGKVSEYLNLIGAELIKNNSYLDLDISTLLKKDFLDEIKNIDISSVEVEIAVEKEISYENEIITAARNSAKEFEANYVKVEWLSKYKKSKMKSVPQFLENIKPRGMGKPIKGINNIKVRGKEGSEDKTIFISRLSEKHELTLEFDTNNNPLKKEAYQQLSTLISNRDILEGNKKK